MLCDDSDSNQGCLLCPIGSLLAAAKRASPGMNIFFGTCWQSKPASMMLAGAMRSSAMISMLILHRALGIQAPELCSLFLLYRFIVFSFMLDKQSLGDIILINKTSRNK